MLQLTHRRAAQLVAVCLLALLLASPAAATVGSKSGTARTSLGAELSVDNSFVSATGWVKPGKS